ncbi:MAG: ABC transporter ATP-binding protein [Myxococcota bacterium]
MADRSDQTPDLAKPVPELLQGLETPDASGRAATRPLAQLGSGEPEDRLSFGVVLQIFARTVPLLATVKWHLALFAGSVVGLTLGGLTLVYPFFDSLWNGVLAGEPIGRWTATVLFIDPEGAVGVESLAPEVRSAIRTHWFWGLLVASLGGFPIAASLIYYQLWILQRINQSLRMQLLERFQTLSLRFHADSRVGDSIYRVYQDSAMVTNVIEMLLLQPAYQLFRFVVAAIAITLLAPWLGVLLMLTLIPALAVSYAFSSPLRQRFRRAREANSGLTSRIQETLVGIKVIKAYGAERAEQARFEADSLHAFDRAFAARGLDGVFGVLVFLIAGGALLGVSSWAAWLSQTEAPVYAPRLLTALGISAWSLGLFNGAKAFAGYSTEGVEVLFGLWAKAQDVAVGLDRVFEVLDLEPEVEDAEDARALPGFERDIRFVGVSFAYEPGRPVLEKVDLRARRGEITAIVGPTGSGKTTLVSLLLRLFDPDDGRIEIDGIDLRELELESLRANIGIALQENLLFATTIRENIRYAVPDASDAQVREAGRVACVDEFVSALSDGYDTLLGERGTKLSTGQRQRISIARAILKDTPILILDEPTAALDAETELAVLRNLEEWGRNRAIFLITHRLSTIRRAQQIAYMREGRIVECGSHGTLVGQRDGAYRRLFELEEAG